MEHEKRGRGDPPKGKPSGDEDRERKRPRREVPLSSDAVKLAVQERLKDIHRDLKETPSARQAKRAAKSKALTMKGVRNLDRLAWVIAHLRDARECVAVYVDTSEHKVRVWANSADDELKNDVARLIKAAAGDGTALTDVKGKLGKSQLDVRTGHPTPKQRTRAESRLTKALEYLAGLGKLGASAPSVEYDIKNGSVHAEQVGADYLLLATPGQPPRLGISKLCCFLCWRALVALGESGKLNVLVTDTHAKVYENWPIPNYLRDAKVLRCFLGVAEKPVTDEDKLLTRAISDNENDVLETIRSFSSVSGSADTGYYSSDDEDVDEGSTTTTAKTKPNTTTTSSQYRDDEEAEEPEESEESEESSVELMVSDDDHSSDEDYVEEKKRS